MRICTKCGKEKELESNYYKHKLGRGGYRAHCIPCSKDFVSQSPERLLERMYAARRRNRAFMWEYYSTHPCVDCGEADPLVLEPDHLVKEDKLDNLSRLVHGTRSLAVIQRELDKCEVVCANCHKRRTAATQGWYADHLLGV